jgi:hypothetical protein
MSTLREQMADDCEDVVFNTDELAESVLLLAPTGTQSTIRAIIVDPENNAPAEIGTGISVAERQIFAMIPVSDMPSLPAAGSTITRLGESWKILRRDRQSEWMWKFTLYIERTEKRIPGRATLR